MNRDRSEVQVAGERQYWMQYVSDRLAGLSTDRPADGRLPELAALFGLDNLDIDILAALWVTAFDPTLRADVSKRDAWHLQLTAQALSGLFGYPLRLRLPSESALRNWRLVEERDTGDGAVVLSPDPQIVAWLEGEHELDAALIGHVSIHPTNGLLSNWPLAATVANVQEGLPQGTRCRVHVLTSDQQSAKDFSAAVAGQLGLPLLSVQTSHWPEESRAERSLKLHRQAYLDRVALYHPLGDVTMPLHLAPFPLQFVVSPYRLPPLHQVRDLQVPLPAPDAAERRVLWLRCHPQAAAWAATELDRLAEDYAAEAGEIAAIAETGPRDAAEAAFRLRLAARDDLGGLAQHIECSFRWDDLVVPPATRERLADIAFEARERHRLWSDAEALRLYPQGRGLVALFAGPPGTGKTMAAQVIAAELGLDLLRIDLSAVISKWVGETAQHLQKVLSSKVARRAVLFFDEADALYGKRVEETRDAQDRYANMDISHLMVALESFDGIVLLATNLKANIDGAFIRRIRHLVDFVKPDADARAEIWRKVLSGLFGNDVCQALAPKLPPLAALEASGAQIKNAALSAVFAARRANRAPDIILLAHMLARELAKDGCGLSARELAEFAEERV